MDGYTYVLVVLEDVSGYMWLTPAKACTAEFTVKQLMAWCAAFGAPKVWVSDNGTHFRTRVLRRTAAVLQIQHRFSVANSAWTNGTAERMMREILKASKAILNERGQPLSAWITVLPLVQWALNTAVRQRFGTSPFQVRS